MPSFSFHPGFAGHSIRCNPWQPTQYVMTAAEHFGVAGSGKVYVVNTTPEFPAGSTVQLIGCWGTSDGAFDACFSEVDSNIVAVACGDGVKLYDLRQSLNCNGVVPIVHITEHRAEVAGLAWNRDSFLSCSWDGSVKLYQAANPQVSCVTFHEHMKEVYEVSWAPRNPTSFLSCSGDGTWKLWDARAPRSTLSQVGHNHQIILTVDWNKYDGNIFATGGVDRSVQLWDLRRSATPLATLPGHENACRRVRFDPHSRSRLASAGYDCRVCIWDLNQPQRPLNARYAHHREFVVGLEWSLAAPLALATAAWDGQAFFWLHGALPSSSPQVPPSLPVAIPPPRMRVPRTKVLPGLPALPIVTPG